MADIQYVKCSNCKGIGRVPKSKGRGLETCPICKGSGKKKRIAYGAKESEANNGKIKK